MRLLLLPPPEVGISRSKVIFLGGDVLNVFLGGGFKHFLFLPLPGEIIQFD